MTIEMEQYTFVRIFMSLFMLSSHRESSPFFFDLIVWLLHLSWLNIIRLFIFVMFERMFFQFSKILESHWAFRTFVYFSIFKMRSKVFLQITFVFIGLSADVTMKFCGIKKLHHVHTQTYAKYQIKFRLRFIPRCLISCLRKYSASKNFIGQSLQANWRSALVRLCRSVTKFKRNESNQSK